MRHLTLTAAAAMALCANGAAAQDESQARGASPKDMHALAQFVQADYPVDALRYEEEGTVTMKLVIGPDGRVAKCTVTVSSGSTSLDEGACKAMTTHAVYEPARNAAGEAISDTLTQSIRYEIPEGETYDVSAAYPIGLEVWREQVFSADYVAALEATDQGAALFFLALDTEGNPTGCGMMFSSGDPAVDQQGCDLLIEHARFRPATLPDGRPYPGVVPVPWPS